MNIFHRKSLLAACIAAMMGLHGYAQKNEASPRLSDYFSPATTNTMSPDSEGFIQRWLLLEPIDKPNRSNTVFTDSYIREAFATEYFPNQFTVLPKDGDKVKATVMFRGREITHQDLGKVLLQRMAETLADVAVQEKPPKTEGRNMTAIFAPKPVKSGK